MGDVERPSWGSRAWPVAGGVVAALVLALLALGRDTPYIAAAATVLVAAALGVMTWAVLRTRAERRRHEDRLAAWAAERAVQAERLRIARDLHDLASHGLGLMTVRAATANLTGAHDDAERRRALCDIERLGSETTTELRGMLRLLRTGGHAPAPVRPADTLENLPGIVEEARRAGLDVELHRGELGEVPAGIQLAVCATVREALANSVHHAGPTAARIVLARDVDGLTVDVSDEGPAPGWRPRAGTGNGLRGLRERLAVHGGTLDAGPTDTAPDGAGFRVFARIPLEAV